MGEESKINRQGSVGVCGGSQSVVQTSHSVVGSASLKFLSVSFHSNCASILLSFRDMTTDWTDNGRTYDGQTSATIA